LDVLGLTSPILTVRTSYSSRPDGANKNVEELTKAYGGKVKAYKLDIGNWENVKAFVDTVIKDFGKIDAFVANAGRTADSGILDGSVEAWMEVIQTDLNGYVSIQRKLRNTC